MTVESLLPWIVSVALLTVRLTAALALSPPFTAYGVPATTRISLTIALAALTFAYRVPAPDAAAWATQPAGLVMPIVAELFVGALLGLGVHVVMAALALAGRLLDVQIGFAIGSVFDPVTRSNSNVLGSLTALAGAAVFFASDAHFELVQLLAQSLDAFPLGKLPAMSDPMRPLLAAGAMFSLGLAFAAPVVAALLLTDVAIGVASRNMPQVNVLILAMPMKIIVGYFVLALAVQGWGPLLRHGFDMTAQSLGAL